MGVLLVADDEGVCVEGLRVQLVLLVPGKDGGDWVGVGEDGGIPIRMVTPLPPPPTNLYILPAIRVRFSKARDGAVGGRHTGRRG